MKSLLLLELIYILSFPCAGIQPHVTLHNFDLPQVLEDEYGGWVSRNIMYVPETLTMVHVYTCVLVIRNVVMIIMNKLALMNAEEISHTMQMCVSESLVTECCIGRL